MSERKDRAFRVRGYDHHERGEKLLGSCATEEQAARLYLKEYLEDWRGGAAEEICLTLRVRDADSLDTDETSFAARMLNVGSPAFEIELQPND
jgi:hypothetical protein